MSETIATKAAAEHCETTPRVLRLFLRASKDYEAVGSGGRYAFTEDDLPELRTRFTAWLTEREATARARAEQAAKDAKKSDDMHADTKKFDNSNNDTPLEGDPSHTNDGDIVGVEDVVDDSEIKTPTKPRGRKPAAA